MKVRFWQSPTLVLLLSDSAVILLSCVVAFLIRYATTSLDMPLGPYLESLPWLFVFPLLYCLFGLYPATFLRRQEEVKFCGTATTIGFMGLAVLSFLTKESLSYSRLALLLAWGLAFFFQPLARHCARSLLAGRKDWGTPCVLFGDGGRVAELCAAIARSPHQPIRITGLVIDVRDGADPADPRFCVPVTVIPADVPQGAETLKQLAAAYSDSHAIVAFRESPPARRREWMNRIDQAFQRIIYVPDMALGGRVWVRAVSIGQVPGILLRQNLLDPRRMALKRSLDLALTILGGLVIFPIMLGLAAAVRLDSPGPVLFRQRRIGKGGKHFTVFKFRTMAVNAEAVLERYLSANPEARAEWDADQKLRHDPRITRVGRFLRKTSLDELPQLINVLRGDMSLVGPRPIVDDEVIRYGEDYALYVRVRPGITGLWQVSGRSDVSYAERVRLDHYYVYNWSVWLDILIIARTVPEVLHCSGAY